MNFRKTSGMKEWIVRTLDLLPWKYMRLQLDDEIHGLLEHCAVSVNGTAEATSRLLSMQRG
jgi:hypothetical protein